MTWFHYRSLARANPRSNAAEKWAVLIGVDDSTGGEGDRGVQGKRLGEVRAKHSLVIVLLGARHVDRIAHSQIEREVRTNLPVVLHEGGA